MSGRDKSELKRGINGMPYLELRHPSGAQAAIYLHGAHLVSWRDASKREIFFVSDKSLFKPDCPIRGGIPVVFPQFGDGPLPKHGFARIREWTFAGTRDMAEYVEAGFSLKDNEQTRRIWPHEFGLELIFRLKAVALEILFSVTNNGKQAFDFKNGLHTYFAVADIGRVSVTGLAGADHIDFLGGGNKIRETRERIEFDRETDRVYPYCPAKIVLEDAGNQRKIIIAKSVMNDVVIWNPWIEKSRKMQDFGDDEYKRMVCVETGNLHDSVSLSPGNTHRSSTLFACA